MRIRALDLSLTATGWASINGPGQRPQIGRVIPSVRVKGCARMEFMLSHIMAEVDDVPDLVAVEGPSYGSQTQYFHESAGLWWQVRMCLHRLGIPVVVISPNSVKKYAIGKGTGDKTLVAIEGGRRFRDPSPSSTDEADALWMLAMCCERYGFPIVDLPAANRAAIYAIVAKTKTKPAHPAIDWPDIRKAA